jgi:hypothetical protein
MTTPFTINSSHSPPPGLDTQAEGRKQRKGCQYTTEERAILGNYKVAYKATTTHAERDALLRGSIFRNIYNYWFQREGDLLTEAEIMIRREVSNDRLSLYVSEHAPEPM